MKNKSHRFEINKPRPRHRHKYRYIVESTLYLLNLYPYLGLALFMMMIMCMRQRLSNIWSSIYEKCNQHKSWVEKKRWLYKKASVTKVENWKYIFRKVAIK